MMKNFQFPPHRSELGTGQAIFHPSGGLPQGDNFQFRKTVHGFTLIEMIIYVALMAIVISLIVGFAFWAIQVGAKATINYEVADNARRAMETMVFEIKRAKSIYTPTAIFDVSPGQISLEQIATTTPDEVTTFVDFFKCADSLCLKREGQDSVKITTAQVKLVNLSFSPLLNSTTTPSVQINLQVDSAVSSSSRPEYFSSIELTTTVALRAY